MPQIMKKILFCLLLPLIFSCKNDKASKDAEKSTETAQIEGYQSFGETIDTTGVLSTLEAQKRFANLKSGDTIQMKFTAEVNSVCQKKGCWMKLGMPENSETMVRFKDYGFFMPKDSKGNKAIVHGKAYIHELSVEERKHYAKDAGKSEAEIAAIDEPEKSMAFEADGVLLK